MQFYNVGSVPPYQPPGNAVYPCVTLSHDDWDDYGFRTTFHLRYYSPDGTPAFKHRVKILQRDNLITRVPAKFQSLDATLYCSVGETADYYQSLADLPPGVWEEIIQGLNDIAAEPRRAEAFRNDPGFDTSLLRFSEAEKAFKEGRSILKHESTAELEKNFAFTFDTTVPGAEGPHIAGFDFSPHPTRLNRVVALIGRNGTGKTQFLARFAQAMSGLGRELGRFEPERPSFSKVIAVSYSVFDEFERPEEAIFSYKYCGIREGDRVIDPERMQRLWGESIEAVHAARREESWNRVMRELLGDVWDTEAVLNKLARQDAYARLSSGQRILALITTEILANMQRESILLFDEPEIHLHPDILSALTRALQVLLHEFESYAIVATHSPILLQEVPRRYVRVFRREGNTPAVAPLGIECFGENLGLITEEVFQLSEARNNYRTYLEELAEENSFEEVLEMFDNRLGLNARAYLASIYHHDPEIF